MASIDNYNRRIVHDPIELVKGRAEIASLIFARRHPEVRITTLRDLLLAASGPGSRKRPGLFRTANTIEIRKMLRVQQEEAFFPRAGSALQSSVEDGRLRVPYGKIPDVLSTLAGDQFVVIVSRANSICPWADSGTARWWPSVLPTGGHWGCPVQLVSGITPWPPVACVRRIESPAVSTMCA